MAVFRKIHTQFWGDPFTQDLTPEQKYFYLYLITNDKTKQCGIYEITKRQMCYDTGYNIDTVSKLLDFFISCKKIWYNTETNELAIKNWDKYNGSTSPKVQSCINEELMAVKDSVLIEYLYGMDRVSILHHNKKKNKKKIQEEEKEEDDFKLFLEKIESPDSFKNWRDECSEFLTAEEFKASFSKIKKIPIGNLEKVMMDFILNVNSRGLFKDCAGLVAHFKNYYPKHVENKINTPSFPHSKGFIEVPDPSDYDKMQTW